MSQKPLVFCLMGPTASGKTQLALTWIEKYPFEIISVDSALVYRGMDIGTAKPDQETLARVPHHLINLLEPNQAYSAADFCRDATIAIHESFQKGKIPLLVGGTMLYYSALQKGLSDLPESNPDIRHQLQQTLNQQGLEYLYKWLQQVDPIAAMKINQHDKQRIQRALEVFELTGKPLSQLQHRTHNPEFNFVNLGILPPDRAVLHERIAVRFKQMLVEGFIDEVTALRARGDLTLDHPSMRAVGYRQVWEYLDGKLTYDEMVEKGIAATRQLAKRQLTWLRHWDGLQSPDVVDKFF